jgi:hypothetical protein
LHCLSQSHIFLPQPRVLNLRSPEHPLQLGQLGHLRFPIGITLRLLISLLIEHLIDLLLIKLLLELNLLIQAINLGLQLLKRHLLQPYLSRQSLIHRHKVLVLLHKQLLFLLEVGELPLQPCDLLLVLLLGFLELEDDVVVSFEVELAGLADLGQFGL